MESTDQKTSIVAFIDILGFKNIVEANNKKGDNALFNELLRAISVSIDKAIKVTINSLSQIGEYFQQNLTQKLNYRIFSDNLFISYDYIGNEEYEEAVYWVTAIVVNYQRSMLERNFYVRVC
jgi:hypothetical protein